MTKTLRRFAVCFSSLVLICFAVVVTNQTIALVEFVGRQSHQAAVVLLYALLTIYACLIISPLLLFLRLPRRLDPPATDHGNEFEEYCRRVSRQLKHLPRLRGYSLGSVGDLKQAVRELDRGADEIIAGTANQVFVTTAISQSGRLDALMVFASQCRMIWRIAHLYRRRPAVRELFTLYSNVAGTAMIAGEVDDVDVEPLITAMLGATLGAVPGLQQVSAVLVKSTLSGSANAFLTLRIGIIAKRYCSSLVALNRKEVRHLASIEAGKLLASIVTKGTKKISNAAWSASRARIRGAFARGEG